MKTTLKALSFVFCALGLLTLAIQADASTMYGATSSGHGELYILNPATGGSLQDIGPLNDVSGLNYSVTGLAFDPNSGVLYGSTGGVSGTKLLTINPATASVSVVGSFSAGTATMTDIAFDQSGNLFGISSSGGANLYSVNKVTGAATSIGASGVSFTEGGGLAISGGGIFYGAPVPGQYGTYNSTTGVYTNIATPASPVGSGGSYAALAFDGATLYGDNLKPGSGGGASHLVKIDPTTGTVTDIGASVTHLDAIAVLNVPEPATGLLLLLGAISLAFRRHRSSERAGAGDHIAPATRCHLARVRKKNTLTDSNKTVGDCPDFAKSLGAKWDCPPPETVEFTGHFLSRISRRWRSSASRANLTAARARPS